MSLSCQPLSTASICLLDHDETCFGCSCRLPAALTQEGQKCKSSCVQSFQISLFHTCSADNCGGGLPITTIGCHSFCVAQGSSGRFLETPPNSRIPKRKSNKLATWPKSPWAQTSAVSDVSQLSSSIRIIVQRGDSLQGLANSATVRL